MANSNLGIYLEIDASQLDELIETMRHAMTPVQFERAMYGIFARTGRRVATILKNDIPRQYQVKGSEVAGAVGGPTMVVGAGNVGCAIPVRGKRKNIGTGFYATGSRRGWESRHGKYKVRARILKAGMSTLPSSMSTYGGMPPFRNIPSKLGKLTFTRAGKRRHPILKVSGIAIPQMPMNRSQAAVQDDILKYMKRRMEQRLLALVKNGR